VDRIADAEVAARATRSMIDLGEITTAL